MKKLLLLIAMVHTMSALAQDHDCNATLSQSELRVFKGMLNGKIAVEIAIQTANNQGELIYSGYIYYPKAKQPAPILIVGRPVKVDPKLPHSDNLCNMRFEEFQNDGSITGRFNLMYYEVEGDIQFYKGSWTNPTTGKSLPMTNMSESFQKPEWYPEEPAPFTAPPREAWHFKHHFNKDKDGWLRDIIVDIYAGDKKSPLSFEEPLCGAFDNYQEQNLPWVTEEDINFDGIPDLMVFIGMTTRAQNMYKAFVWNPVTRQFYYVNEFEEIQEPDIDHQAKTITSVARELDCFYIDVYKWKNGKLTRISNKKVCPND